MDEECEKTNDQEMEWRKKDEKETKNK